MSTTAAMKREGKGGRKVVEYPRRHLYIATHPFWRPGNDLWAAWAYGAVDIADAGPTGFAPSESIDTTTTMRAPAESPNQQQPVQRRSYPCPDPHCSRKLEGPSACDEHHAAQHSHTCSPCGIHFPSPHLLHTHIAMHHPGAATFLLAGKKKKSLIRGGSGSERSAGVSATADAMEENDPVETAAVGSDGEAGSASSVPLPCVVDGCAAVCEGEQGWAAHLARVHRFPRGFRGWRGLRVPRVVAPRGKEAVGSGMDVDTTEGGTDSHRGGVRKDTGKYRAKNNIGGNNNNGQRKRLQVSGRRGNVSLNPRARVDAGVVRGEEEGEGGAGGFKQGPEMAMVVTEPPRGLGGDDFEGAGHVTNAQMPPATTTSTAKKMSFVPRSVRMRQNRGHPSPSRDGGEDVVMMGDAAE